MSPRCWAGEFVAGVLGVFLSVSVSLGEAGDAQVARDTAPPGAPANKAATAGAAETPITRVTRGTGVLPNESGQQWREYDIRPYTSRVTTTSRPEQAIIDWILRETGTEVWFSPPLGLLNADRDVLRVYHTPEMHKLIQEVVDRFVSSQAESQAFSLQLITVGSPNWRSRAMPLMRSVTVQSPGVDAWLVTKENAAILINELRKRVDVREHNSPNMLIQNGQSQTITRLQPRHYVRSVRMRDNTFPGYELEMGQIQEGFSLQISPLLSLDERTVDAVIKCYIDQVERLIPVNIDVPSLAAQRQSVQVQVPQMVSWRLHERFRWPAEEVLVLSCGVVATPSAERSAALGLASLLTANPARADAVLFVQSNGTAGQALLEPERTATGAGPNYRGRY